MYLLFILVDLIYLDLTVRLNAFIVLMLILTYFRALSRFIFLNRLQVTVLLHDFALVLYYSSTSCTLF